jgi:hypothetical protein
MRRIFPLLLLTLTIAVPARGFAWGCVGHQTVAYIASKNLNPVAAAKVTALLSDAQSQYTHGMRRFCAPTKLGNLEYFATWADDARTEGANGNAGWHFWDIPLAKDAAAMPAFCQGGCVVSALQAQVATLTNPASSPAAQQKALLFVVHLVGDAHQPMHIVDNGDRGGNCVPVSFTFKGESKTTSASATGSYSPNLHSIWDDNIIETITGVEKAANRDQLTQAFADKVIAAHADDIAAAQQQQVNFQTDFETWALQAHTLAGPDSYSRMPTAIPVDPNPQTLQSCNGVSSKFVSLSEVAQGDFILDNQGIVMQQLALAGARLAATLNTIWPATPAVASAK